MPSHHLNQCWNFVYWTLRNKLQWNFNRNSGIFIQENAFESVVREMAAILSRPQWVICGWSSLFPKFDGLSSTCNAPSPLLTCYGPSPLPICDGSCFPRTSDGPLSTNSGGSLIVMGNPVPTLKSAIFVPITGSHLHSTNDKSYLPSNCGSSSTCDEPSLLQTCNKTPLLPICDVHSSAYDGTILSPNLLLTCDGSYLP